MPRPYGERSPSARFPPLTRGANAARLPCLLLEEKVSAQRTDVVKQLRLAPPNQRATNGRPCIDYSPKGTQPAAHASPSGGSCQPQAD